MTARTDTGWLDALARRAVAREARRPGAPTPPSGGLSRRLLIRAAAATVAAGGVLRVAAPQEAAAQDPATCIKVQTEKLTAALAECKRGPSADYTAAGKRYDQAAALLKTSQTAKQRKATEAQLAGALNAMTGAISRLGQCDSGFSKGLNDARFNCTVLGPPQPPSPDDEPGQQAVEVNPGGCPGQTYLCGDGRCCYTGTYCCSCACCVYRDCRCCVAA